MAYAGFWLRVVAYIIDGILLGVVMWIVNLALGIGAISDPAQMAQMTDEQAMELMGTMGRNLVISQILGVLLYLVYWSAMESSAKQATLGKMVVGIRVTDANGGRLSFGHALGRTAAKFISAIILCIGFLMVAFTERKQGLHDRRAGTLVVKKGGAPA